MLIKWGILGSGWIANKIATSAKVVENVKIIANASNTEGRAEAFARKHRIEKFYTDYASMLKNKEIDAVYVATTHNYHYQNVKEVLEAGKHVLCEKPFAVNASEMSHLIAIASEKGLFMMEAMWTRFLPAMSYVRELLDSNVIGDIKQVNASFGFRFPFDPEHRLYNPKLAGGAVLDAGIYPISFANMVMRSKPIEVKAIAEIGTTGVDEQSTYIFRYESGALALLNSTVNAPITSRAEIIGTNGRILIPKDFLAADEVWLDVMDPTTLKEIWQDLKEIGTIKKRFDYDLETGYQFEIEAASQSIRNRELENKIMPISDTFQLMEIIDEIRDQLGLIYENDKNII